MISFGEQPGGVDSTNKFLVGTRGDKIVIGGLVPANIVLKREEALNLAAWIVVQVDTDMKELMRLLKAIAAK